MLFCTISLQSIFGVHVDRIKILKKFNDRDPTQASVGRFECTVLYFLIIRCIYIISAYVTLDHDICMHACLVAQGSSLFKLVKITMAAVDSQVFKATSAILS